MFYTIDFIPLFSRNDNNNNDNDVYFYSAISTKKKTIALYSIFSLIFCKCI